MPGLWAPPRLPALVPCASPRKRRVFLLETRSHSTSPYWRCYDYTHPRFVYRSRLARGALISKRGQYGALLAAKAHELDPRQEGAPVTIAIDSASTNDELVRFLEGCDASTATLDNPSIDRAT